MFGLLEKLKNKIEKFKRMSEEEARESRTIHKDNLILHWDDKNRARLYCKGNELTKHVGFGVRILADGVWHDSVNSEQKVRKISQKELQIALRLFGLPLRQVWDIKINEENNIVWSLSLELEEPIRIDMVNAMVFLSKSYSHWVSPLRQGRFCTSFNSHWQGITSFEDNPGFIGLVSSREEFPSIILRDSGNKKASLLVQNSDLNLCCRVLEIQCEEEKEFYQPGTYSFIKACIQFYPDKAILENLLQEIVQRHQQEILRRQEEERLKQEQERKRQEEIRRQEEERLRLVQQEQLKRQEQERKRQEEIRRQEELKREEERKRQEEKRFWEEQERFKKTQEEDRKQRTLENGVLKLYFDKQNRIHIYYKDNELTKGNGLNAGVLCEGNWYGLLDSKVEIERPTSEKMTIRLISNQLPLIQNWYMELTSEGILIWDVDIHITEPLRIDRKNVSLSLSKSYSDWIAPPEEGKFPSFSGLGWQVMNPFKYNFEFIGARSPHHEFPSIILRDSGNKKASLLVQNSDLNLCCRVLEIQCEEEKEFYQPGTYSFIKACIQFYPDKAILENLLQEIVQRHQQEILRRQEEERLKQEQERKRQEEIRRQEELKREEGLRMQKELETKEMAFLRFKEGIKAITPSENNIYIYGDCEELHDKISSESGGFKKIISKIHSRNKHGLNIKIGISKFNFFKLNTIAQFSSKLINRRLDLRSISLNLFPLRNLYSNFEEYIKELNARIGLSNIRLFLKDEGLLDLLWAVSSQADQHNEKDLLRLLGVVAEHAFIGPQTIVLDTFHRCNTNCIHCWVHTPKRGSPHRLNNIKMDFNMYKNIVDDAARMLCDEIIFQGDGEPLLDSRFFEMARYARDKGLKVIFFTNGILLDREKARQIINLEISEIFCSLPAGIDKTYAIVNSSQSRNTFHKIVDNLKNLISLRDGLKTNKPWLQMTHVIHNLNYRELEEMAKIDAFIGTDKVRFYLIRLDEHIKSLKLNIRHIEVIKKSLKKAAPYLKKKNIALQDNIYFQLENYNHVTGSWSGNAFLRSGCPVGWFFCLALARGELSMCCHLRTLDRLNEKAFAQIWNSENYNKLRTQAKYLQKNKDIVFYNGRKLYDEFCSHCDTHQVILMINGMLQKYKLDKFI